MHNIDQIMAMYWEADRTAVKRQYEALFGSVHTHHESVDQDDAVTDVEDSARHTRTARSQRRLKESLGEEFSRFFADVGLSDQIQQMMHQFWSALAERGKAVALHYMYSLLDQRFTPGHGMEGLLHYFQIEAASHFCHAFLPGAAFPVNRDVTRSYLGLRQILSLFGIQFEDQKELLEVDVWLNLTIAVEDFREQHGLEDWQVWALIYDLGPRLLPKPGPYPQEPSPRVWIVATHDRLGEFETIDGHDEKTLDAWAINRKARRGDLALMYCVAPRSAFVSVYRCATDAHRDPFGGWSGYRAEITDKIAVPWILLSELKADPVIRDWRLVRSNFQGLLQHEVPAEVWKRLCEIVGERDPIVGARLSQYALAGEGCSVIKDAGEEWSEKEVEDKLVIPLLSKVGWKLESTLMQQIPMSIKVGSGRPLRVYADFVGYRDSLTSESLLVVEVKRRVRSQTELNRAVEQAESYAGKLRCSRFAVAAPEGFWIYELRFPGQSSLLATITWHGDVSQVAIDSIGALIGFEALTHKIR